MIKNAIKTRAFNIAFLVLIILAVLFGNLRFNWFNQCCNTCKADDLVIYQDFGDWTEVDTTNKLGEWGTEIIAIDLEREDTSYFYYDFGSNYWSGDFEFKFKYYHSSSYENGEMGWIMLCNTVGDRYYMDNNATEDFISTYVYDTGTTNRVYVREREASTQYYSSVNDTITDGTWQYIKFKRDESVGTYGTLYTYVYSDDTYTTLIDSASLTLHAKNDFRYMVVTSAYGGGSFPTASIVGTFKHLTLEASVNEREADIDANAAIDSVTDGTEEVTAVDWITPRCAYADEDIGFLVTGDSGADVNLKLYDSRGYEIDIKSDSVRTDGYYRWTIEVPATTNGFIRAFETNSGIYSDWGYCLPEPDGDQLINVVQAIDAENPQYFRPWDDYRASEKTIQLIHYKTNIDSTDFADYSLRIWHLGDSGTEVYNDTFDDISDNYYLNDPDNDDMNHWRYMLFSFNGNAYGLDDKDGLIVDLDIDYAYSTSGFYQALIYEDGVGEYTNTNSCYWYNHSNDDGIKMQTDLSDYILGDICNITLNIGNYSHVLDELETVELDLYNGSEEYPGTLLYSYDDETITDNMTVINEVLPLWTGDYYILLTFTGSNSFEYKQALTFNTDSSGGTTSTSDSWFDLLGKFDDSMAAFGLGGSAGHIFIMILVMFVCFVVFHKSALLRVVVPICVMALAFAFGWVPMWIFVMIALGAGLLIALGVNRVIHGGGE